MSIEKINSENDLSFKDLVLKINAGFDFLKTKIKTILYATFLGALIGFLIAFIIKPTYKAVLTFAMEEEKGVGSGGLSSAIGLASSFGIDLGGTGGGGAFAASNLSALMKSHLIIEKVLLNSYKINGKNQTLANYYIDINNLRKKWSKNPILKNIDFLPNADRTKFTRIQDSILFEFHKKLTKNGNLEIQR
jgi:uncharacterized protein involved in exopolysaccharide biosynthesis